MEEKLDEIIKLLKYQNIIFEKQLSLQEGNSSKSSNSNNVRAMISSAKEKADRKLQDMRNELGKLPTQG